MSNPFYTRIANTDQAGADLVIEHNYGDYNEEGRKMGLYVHGGSEFGTYSVDDIPRMIETLQAVYDDFEAHKPKEPTIADQMAAAPVGSLVVSTRGGTGWHKVEGGLWVSVYGDEHNSTDFHNGDFSSYRFAYNPEEAN